LSIIEKNNLLYSKVSGFTLINEKKYGNLLLRQNIMLVKKIIHFSLSWITRFYDTDKIMVVIF